ncbi:MAG TPA: helix-turn-helix domain-containing protein [Gaiellaceae bacterium]|nr:helix-turn-helix domain-containing protein [Gaiellaceae bacterium]
MNEDGAVLRLTELGLTSYEAKAYVALMRRDSSTAAQTARLSNVPRQRIYDVLAALVEKGLASTRPGDVVKYAATPPARALEGLLARRRQELQSLEQSAAETITHLEPAYRAGQAHTDPLEYIEVLRDRRAINERFFELQEDIKDEILVFTKPPYATPAQENPEGLEVARTHRARSLYEYSAFDDPAFAEGVRRFIEAGEDARFVPELPLKLVIIDEAIVMFGLEDPVAGSAGLTMMVVDHPALAQTLKVSFDAFWDQGLTFDQAAEATAFAGAPTA